MHIFLRNEDSSEMFCCLPTDHWELRLTPDYRGYATIELHLNDTVYQMLNSRELMETCPDVSSDLIYDLYRAIMDEAIDSIKYNERYIDLSEIYASVLPRHREQWRREGYIVD